ncbi:hypothetical protein KUCAC02_028466 [Chaenocephalus aceratus]|uniref:Uncharacterized protein n=1 Tax=Chaenocephalus aceratus TaxID=36190 RepID=A0ACB9X3Z3_CHAAC|nr:hypothetical protein KUCAC02_028466 [Chaenocephalus aceratus]
MQPLGFLSQVRVNSMKLICKSDGFLQTGQPLFGAEIHQRQSLQLVYQVGRDMHRLSIKSVLHFGGKKKDQEWSPVGEIDPAAAARYATFGFFITGPVSHIFYQLMEVWMPATDPLCKGWRDFESKMGGSYWTALKMNWKVWTPFQFVNIHFVPVEFRVLFANMVALFWYAYLASVRK